MLLPKCASDGAHALHFQLSSIPSLEHLPFPLQTLAARKLCLDALFASGEEPYNPDDWGLD